VEEQRFQGLADQLGSALPTQAGLLAQPALQVVRKPKADGAHGFSHVIHGILRFKYRRVDLIAGDSTNGLIAALQLQRLDDDRAYFPPYDAVPVFRAETLRRHPELVPLLNGLAGRLSVSTMQRLTAAVDLQRQSPALVVQRWRQGRSYRLKTLSGTGVK